MKEVDWSKAPGWAKFHTLNSCGQNLWFENKPNMGRASWVNVNSGRYLKEDSFDYENSLQERPVEDPYVELRAASKDPTKQIRVRSGNHWFEWQDSGYYWNFSDPVSSYQIRDKPIEDPYAELRLAAKDPTKQIRLVNPERQQEYPWASSRRVWLFDSPVSWYQIRDKPIEDLYTELKAAAMDPTKEIRYKNYAGQLSDWMSGKKDWKWQLPASFYEIRDKPIEDPYAELKAAIKDLTKQIRLKYSENEWYPWKDYNTYPWRLDRPVSEYEILDKAIIKTAKTAYRRLWKWRNEDLMQYMVRDSSELLDETTLGITQQGHWLGETEEFTYEDKK